MFDPNSNPKDAYDIAGNAVIIAKLADLAKNHYVIRTYHHNRNRTFRVIFDKIDEWELMPDMQTCCIVLPYYRFHKATNYFCSIGIKIATCHTKRGLYDNLQNKYSKPS